MEIILTLIFVRVCYLRETVFPCKSVSFSDKCTTLISGIQSFLSCRPLWSRVISSPTLKYNFYFCIPL